MKKNYLVLSAAILAFGLFAFQKTTKTSGVFGKYMKVKSQGVHTIAFDVTNAPGETNCTACHSGSTINGLSENVLTVRNQSFQVVNTYVPGESYIVSLEMNSSTTGNPVEKGFATTALNSSLAMAGSLTGDLAFSTQDFTLGAKEYITHNDVYSAIWAWTWDAPATNMGDVTFYVSSMLTNDNNTNQGDDVYTSAHTIGSTVGIDEGADISGSFTAGYSVETNAITLDFYSLTASQMNFDLLDMNGKSVYSKNMEKATIGENLEFVSIPESVKNGQYIVKFSIGNRMMTSNISIQK